jgi:hypothetical protein
MLTMISAATWAARPVDHAFVSLQEGHGRQAPRLQAFRQRALVAQVRGHVQLIRVDAVGPLDQIHDRVATGPGAHLDDAHFTIGCDAGLEVRDAVVDAQGMAGSLSDVRQLEVARVYRGDGVADLHEVRLGPKVFVGDGSTRWVSPWL